MRPVTRAALFFGLGFFLGPVGDYCHVLSGTLVYPQDAYLFYFRQMPFWTPLLFGSATLALGMSRPFFGRSKVQTYLGLPVFLATYALSGFLPKPAGGIADVILAAIAFVSWVAFDRSLVGILFGVLSALAGTAVESFLVHQSVFSYLPLSNNLFGVPSWLPWLYFTASMGVGSAGQSALLPLLRK
jgi:hypothetical protein